MSYQQLALLGMFQELNQTKQMAFEQRNQIIDRYLNYVKDYENNPDTLKVGQVKEFNFAGEKLEVIGDRETGWLFASRVCIDGEIVISSFYTDCQSDWEIKKLIKLLQRNKKRASFKLIRLDLILVNSQKVHHYDWEMIS